MKEGKPYIFSKTGEGDLNKDLKKSYTRAEETLPVMGLLSQISGNLLNWGMSSPTEKRYDPQCHP